MEKLYFYILVAPEGCTLK